MKRQRDDEAIERLRTLCPPGTTIYGKVTHVARSGMSRRIALYVGKGDDIVYLDPTIDAAYPNEVADRRFDRDAWDGLFISGCGMDMRFAMVYRLSRLLHGDGYALTARAL